MSGAGEYFCEISAWCPVENDEKLSSKTPLLKNTEKFTVYIKNSVAFPYFGSDYRKNNILSEYEEIIMSLQTIVLTIQIYLSFSISIPFPLEDSRHLNQEHLIVFVAPALSIKSQLIVPRQ